MAAEYLSVASLGNDGYLPKICKRHEDTIKTKLPTRVFWFFFLPIPRYSHKPLLYYIYI